MSPAILALGSALFATLSVGGLLIAIFYPHMNRKAEFERRLARVAGVHERVQGAPGKDDEHRRRQQAVEKTLRQLEEKQQSNNNAPSLMVRLQQAQLDWTRNFYILVCFGAGVVCAVVALGSGATGPVASAIAPVAGFLLPRFYVNSKRKARFKRFTSEFPGAVDVIVRGIKSGLPLADCMKIIASEAPEPVRSEFRAVVEDQMLGMPMPDAVQRMVERVPLTEASFFAIVIAIQSRTGGSLSEALGNLSKVLRERKKMEAKIKAMSAEAKASAGIIGSLPPIVGGLVYLTSPDYIMLLFSTFTGNAVLIGSGLWMLIGVLVMRKMINFDF